MNSQDMIHTGMRHHQAGRLAEAEKIYRQILSQRPNDADALHLLGVLAGQIGKRELGIELIRRAVAGRPDYPEAHANLGRLLFDHGALEESAAAYERAARLRPGDPQPLNSLGTVRKTQGRAEHAEKAYRRAIEIQPKFFDAHLNLAKLLRGKGNNEDAAAVLRRAIEIDPKAVTAHNELGNALAEMGKAEEAIEAFSSAVRLQPDLAETHFKIGQLQRELERHDEALAAYQRAVEARPDYAEAMNNVANLFRKKGMIAEALAMYDKTIATKPDMADAHFNLGQLHWQAGRYNQAGMAFQKASLCRPNYAEAVANMAAALASLQKFDEALYEHKRAEEMAPGASFILATKGWILVQKGEGAAAIELLRKSLELNPDSEMTWGALASALRAQGKFDEAAECIRRVQELYPDEMGSVREIAETGTDQAEKGKAERLEEMLADEKMPAEDRIATGFSLGKLLDEENRFDEAFARYDEANRLMKQLRREGGESFSPAKNREYVDGLIARFTPEYFESVRGWGDESELPVFVVGMPRSGTTLIEQISASHADVFGAGELLDINRIQSALGKDWTAESIGEAARAHVKKLKERGGEVLRVVDKLPGNVMNLGLIATMYPKARVIFARRDPRDNCLSCYFQYFATGLMYTYDLEDCGRYCAQVLRIMDHWLKVLPLRMLEMQYETLVGDLEGQSRRLIDFLGLPWDPACLEFHKTERTVLTASVWQVRQPIYNSSVGRWKHYEKYLGPLMRGLEEGAR